MIGGRLLRETDPSSPPIATEVGFAEQLAPAHLQVHELRVCTPFGYENVWSMEYDPSERGQQF
jgi:hypothetical protein